MVEYQLNHPETVSLASGSITSWRSSQKMAGSSPDHPAAVAASDLRDPRDQQAHRAPSAPPAKMDPTASMDLLVKRALPELLARRAPSGQPSSSSVTTQ
jgi:hypothetical protein